MKRKAYTIIFIVLVVIFSVYFYSHGSKSNHKSNHSANEASSSMQVDANKYKNVNADLKNNLNQDQSYADQNPNNYGYAKQIESVQYTGKTDILVNVKPSFKELTPDQKTNVMNQTQNLAKMVLRNDGKIDDQDVTDGLIVTVNCGSKPIGESKVSDHKNYSWY